MKRAAVSQSCGEDACPEVAGPARKRILITGATGLLGRQVYALMSKNTEYQLTGTCRTRSRPGLVAIDLVQEGTIDELFESVNPDVVLHFAAERRPDAVKSAPDQARALNTGSTAVLAKACARTGAWMLYLSTDYVFDGTAPPYSVQDQPNPLNAYAAQKLEGEVTTLEVAAPNAAVLRVPLLYGPVEYLMESPVTALYDDWQKGCLAKADDLQRRYPTYTLDLARVIACLVEARLAGKDVTGIFHWQATECFTKYGMAMVLAAVTGDDMGLVQRDKSGGGAGAKRPENSQLECSRIEEFLGGDPGKFRTPFREAVAKVWAEYARVKSDDESSEGDSLEYSKAKSVAARKNNTLDLVRALSGEIGEREVSADDRFESLLVE